MNYLDLHPFEITTHENKSLNSSSQGENYFHGVNHWSKLSGKSDNNDFNDFAVSKHFAKSRLTSDGLKTSFIQILSPKNISNW